MQVALDPYMLRRTPLDQLPGLVASLGYDAMELSPRQDLLPFFVHPRADRHAVAGFRSALRSAGVALSSILPLYRWSSPDEDERAAAIRYWRRAIEIAVELDCRVMNSEFSGRPERAEASEAQFWRSMEELLPIFEREGIALRLEPHPDDFVEDGMAAIDLIRAIDSPFVSFVYCVPHTFHMGGDLEGIIKYGGSLVTHCHLADVFDHRASSGLRYILNPPGTAARVHQHLDIGQGEIDWESFFRALAAIQFDGTLVTCVFAWEERAEASARHMRATIDDHLQRAGLAA